MHDRLLKLLRRNRELFVNGVAEDLMGSAEWSDLLATSAKLLAASDLSAHESLRTTLSGLIQQLQDGVAMRDDSLAIHERARFKRWNATAMLIATLEAMEHKEARGSGTSAEGGDELGDGFTFDKSRGQLQWRSKNVKVGAPRSVPCRFMAVLHENLRREVSIDTLRNRVWGDRVLSDDTIYGVVSDLRKSIRESGAPLEIVQPYQGAYQLQIADSSQTSSQD